MIKEGQERYLMFVSDLTSDSLLLSLHSRRNFLRWNYSLRRTNLFAGGQLLSGRVGFWPGLPDPKSRHILWLSELPQGSVTHRLQFSVFNPCLFEHPSVCLCWNVPRHLKFILSDAEFPADLFFLLPVEVSTVRNLNDIIWALGSRRVEWLKSRDGCMILGKHVASQNLSVSIYKWR